MILFPPCKINLGLRVISKREDGYHSLETLMFQLPFTDILEIVKAENFSIKTTGIEIQDSFENNLCFKAYQLLKKDFKIGNVSIHLHKNIPMGAGLGGGSADGTYTLLLLNELFELKLNNDTLREYAAELGSDCPLFVEKSPQIATGRGEILAPFSINLSGYYIHIINLGIHVNTKDAFSNLVLNQQKESIIETLKLPISDWKITLKNDFETTVFEKYPELKNLKTKLYQEGADYVSMTGSGSTIFAIKSQKPSLLFENQKENIIEKIVYIN